MQNIIMQTVLAITAEKGHETVLLCDISLLSSSEIKKTAHVY